MCISFVCSESFHMDCWLIFEFEPFVHRVLKVLIKCVFFCLTVFLSLGPVRESGQTHSMGDWLSWALCKVCQGETGDRAKLCQAATVHTHTHSKCQIQKVILIYFKTKKSIKCSFMRHRLSVMVLSFPSYTYWVILWCWRFYIEAFFVHLIRLM